MNSPYMTSGGTLKPNAYGVFPSSTAVSRGGLSIGKQAELARTMPQADADGVYGRDPLTGGAVRDYNTAKAWLNEKPSAIPWMSKTGWAAAQNASNATQLKPRNNGGSMPPVGQTPYTPGMSSYQRTGFRAPIKSGRSRLDPERIAGKMARGTARPGEVAAAKMMQEQEDRKLGIPILQGRAQEAEFQNSLLADPATRDALRKRMMDFLGTQDQTNTNQTNTNQTNTTTPTKAATTADYTAQNGGLTPQRPSTLDAAYKSGAMTRPGTMAYRAEGGEIEMGDDDEGDEDAFLLGEEGPEIGIKRDDGSIFVLPADVTKKVMAGFEMEDTEDNQDAMAAAMQRMGMEPKMGGGKMGARMGGGPMAPRQLMSKEERDAERQQVREFNQAITRSRGGIPMPGVSDFMSPDVAFKATQQGGAAGGWLSVGLAPRMNGGTMMAKETGRMAPKSRTIGDRGAGSRTIGDRGAGSRTQTRKNSLFDAMKKLI
jgi:hypothetical protein